jgi:hypothetical protein
MRWKKGKHIKGGPSLCIEMLMRTLTSKSGGEGLNSYSFFRNIVNRIGCTFSNSAKKNFVRKLEG